jgi:hypothetical protein
MKRKAGSPYLGVSGVPPEADQVSGNKNKKLKPLLPAKPFNGTQGKMDNCATT